MSLQLGDTVVIVVEDAIAIKDVDGSVINMPSYGETFTVTKIDLESVTVQAFWGSKYIIDPVFLAKTNPNLRDDAVLHRLVKALRNVLSLEEAADTVVPDASEFENFDHLYEEYAVELSAHIIFQFLHDVLSGIETGPKPSQWHTLTTAHDVLATYLENEEVLGVMQMFSKEHAQ